MDEIRKLNGLIVFYVNLGSLPPKKGEQHVLDYKAKLKEDGFLDRMKQNGFECLFVPNRELTHVEVLKF